MSGDELVKQVKKEIALDDSGLIDVKTLEDQYRVANMFVKSGLLPRQYDTPEKVITGMQFARELGLKPLTALRQIAIINGSPSLFGDLPLSLVYASGLLEYIDEFYLDKDRKRISTANENVNAKVWAHVTIVKRRGEEREHESFFSVDDANIAGLYAKKDSIWNKYEKDMLKYRARARALKNKFPDVLGGISIKEYDFDGVEFSNKKINDNTKTKEFFNKLISADSF